MEPHERDRPHERGDQGRPEPGPPTPFLRAGGRAGWYAVADGRKIRLAPSCAAREVAERRVAELFS